MQLVSLVLGCLALLSTWPRVPCTSSIPFITDLCSIMAQRMEVPTVESQAFVSAATQLKSAGQQEAALVKYQQAVEICPTYAEGFYDLGVYYSENNQVGCFASSTCKAYQQNLHCIVIKHTCLAVHGDKLLLALHYHEPSWAFHVHNQLEHHVRFMDTCFCRNAQALHAIKSLVAHDTLQ